MSDTVVNRNIESESKLSFFESTGIIIGHGVGSGILAVPYLASRNTWWDFIWIIGLSYAMNLLLHLMIAELSLNNGGAQFVKCLENNLFKGKIKKAASVVCLLLLGFSVLMNCSSYIAGSVAVLTSWFSLNRLLGTIIYYLVVGLVVFFGMKIVGICEKYSVFIMSGVVVILFIATMFSEKEALPTSFRSFNNCMALYSMISFALSGVMSVPTVVKGLNGDTKKVRGSIALGIGLNAILISLVTFMTLLGAGTSISENGALVDLANHLGGWVSIVGYIFQLLALSTSFWANTLNLRDMVHESTKLNNKLSWVIASTPSLIIALIGVSSLVGFARLASVVQILTGVMVIIAYNISRRAVKDSPICGMFGSVPFQIAVVISSILATVGSLLSVI